MSNFNRGDKIVAEEIKALKASVKAEMQRRNRSGSLSAYAGTAYDFIVVPATGVQIYKEHYTKIREPISKINTDGLPSESQTNMPSLTALEGKLTLYKSDTGKSSTTHHCMASCSGLCYNSCSEGCTSCTATCANSCDLDCIGGCTSCSSTCSGGCTGCTDACSGCGSQCQNSCVSYCSTGCRASCGECSNTCLSYCTNACSGCGSGCANTCSGGCKGNFML